MRTAGRTEQSWRTDPSAITLVGVATLIAVIAVAVFFLLQRQVRPRASLPACVANLKQIDGAKEQWALENRKPVGTPAEVSGVNAYLKNSQAPVCPAGGVYTYNPVGVAPVCSVGARLNHVLSASWPSVCRTNLAEIEAAKAEWARRNKKPNGTPADVEAVNHYLKNSTVPVCPAGGTYMYNLVGVAPKCSFDPAPDHSLSSNQRKR